MLMYGWLNEIAPIMEEVPDPFRWSPFDVEPFQCHILPVTSVHINMKYEVIHNGEEPYDRQCAKDNGVFCAALSFILFSAKILWYGGSIHHRAVLWQ